MPTVRRDDYYSSKGWQRNLRRGYFVEGAEPVEPMEENRKAQRSSPYSPDSVVQEVKKVAGLRNIEIAGPFKPSTP